MALVTVQRSPSPSNTSESSPSDLVDALVDSDSSPQRSKRSKSALKKLRRFLNTVRFVTSLRFSESYLAVKGAAIILPQSECLGKSPKPTSTQAGKDIHSHLQAMFYLLRPQDTIQVAIKLESAYPDHHRYLVVVSTTGRQDTDESVILGIDCAEQATIGLVLPIWGDTHIRLDGDGGFSVTSNETHKIFKPVSVQAMWSALQSLIKVRDLASKYNYHPRGLTHTWVTYYEFRIKSDSTYVAEWNIMDDIESHRPDSPLVGGVHEESDFEKLIKTKLKEIMMTVDLEEVTSKFLRTKLEADLKKSLLDYRQLIDQETIFIMRQLDSPSQIFDYLYLGSEWNACNFNELRHNGVGHILNVTREIDNFFPGRFIYHNVRVYDTEQAELLKYWEHTHKFINKAKQENSKVLVHCKMGISRSASTVMAYAMKEYGWSLKAAYDYVQGKRSCVRPNPAFHHQLTIYEGILEASKNRETFVQKSRSENNLDTPLKAKDETDWWYDDLSQSDLEDMESLRPKSWPYAAQDDTMVELLKSKNLDDSWETASVFSGSRPGSIPEVQVEDTDSSPSVTPWAADGPLQVALDNWDEIDASSRSADSLDDVYHGDTVASAACGESEQPVKLLFHRPYHKTLSDDEEMLTEGSDMDESSDLSPPAKCQKGFYDIRMLAGEQCVFPNVPKSDPGDLGAPSRALPTVIPMETDYLHPDMKLELIMSQLKKQKQLWKLKNERFQSKLLSSTPVVPKLRADDCWICEQPASPVPVSVEGDGEGTEGTTVLENTGVVTAAAAGLLQVKKHDILRRAASQDALQDLVESGALIDTEEVTPNISVRRERDISRGQPCPDKREIGVRQHYQKEEIPWSPGTVKRQREDIEKKIQSDRLSQEAPVLRLSCSSDSPVISPHSSCEMIAEHRMKHLQVDSVHGTIKPASRESNRSPCVEVVSADTSQVCAASPVVVCDRKPSTAEVPPHAEKKERPSSIYDSEAIEWKPGMVQRTKDEIEARSRSSSFESLLFGHGHRPVQRSSSLRSQRSLKAKDRDSPRRKTCLPVLHPSPSPDKELVAMEHTPASNLLVPGLEERRARSEEPVRSQPMDRANSDSFKVIKIGTDKVPLAEGTVKRHTQDYEDLCIEVEGKTQENKSPDSQEMDITSSSATETAKLNDITSSSATETAKLSEENEIPSGVVQKQLQEIKIKYGSSSGQSSNESLPSTTGQRSDQPMEEKSEQKRESLCMDTPADQETKRRKVDRSKKKASWRNGRDNSDQVTAKQSSSVSQESSKDSDTIAPETMVATASIELTIDGNSTVAKPHSSEPCTVEAEACSSFSGQQMEAVATTVLKRKSQPREEEHGPEFRFKMSKETLCLIREAGKKFSRAQEEGRCTNPAAVTPGEGVARKCARDAEGRWGKVKVPCRYTVYERQRSSPPDTVTASETVNTSAKHDKPKVASSREQYHDNLQGDKESLSSGGAIPTKNGDVVTSFQRHSENPKVSQQVDRTKDSDSMITGASDCQDSVGGSGNYGNVGELDSKRHKEEELTVRDLVGKFDRPASETAGKTEGVTVESAGQKEQASGKSVTYRHSLSAVEDVAAIPKQLSEETKSKRHSIHNVPKSESKGHNRSSSQGDLCTYGGLPHVRISPDREPDPETSPQKPRRPHGKSHPLSRLTLEGRTKNPFYNTM